MRFVVVMSGFAATVQAVRVGRRFIYIAAFCKFQCTGVS